MKTATIVQARMGSSRLPGKVMMDLGGHTVLARVVQRLRRARLIGDLVIATTSDPADDVIVEECKSLGVAFFRGEANDVLDRYYRAAQHFGADAIVRITSDCPLIEPEITDNVIRAFFERRPDYASNAFDRTYPRGLDTEVFTFETLARVWRSASKTYQRSHVTCYVYENPDHFNIVSVTGETDYSWQRWTLDTPEDLAFIRAVYELMDNQSEFYWRDVINAIDRRPELLELNCHVMQKALQQG
jgi:spore coat polysaccharide biosynthesis protein SpsF